VSTIVFVVRKGNPKGIKDWPDLAQPDVKVITPNPKTSGNGKWSLLAAYGSVILRGGSEADAEQFLEKLFGRVPVLDTSARAATMTFSQKKIGDVHLTWENEAFLEVAEAKGELEIIRPAISVLAEPHVAVVTANARRKGTFAAAEAYMRFAYTPEAQDLIAKHHYRPTDPEAWERHKDEFGTLEMFDVAKLTPGMKDPADIWAELNRRFFSEGALFDSIYTRLHGGGKAK
jgi:sulfate transport system substrate-binding protein